MLVFHIFDDPVVINSIFLNLFAHFSVTFSFNTSKEIWCKSKIRWPTKWTTEEMQRSQSTNSLGSGGKFSCCRDRLIQRCRQSIAHMPYTFNFWALSLFLDRPLPYNICDHVLIGNLAQPLLILIYKSRSRISYYT